MIELNAGWNDLGSFESLWETKCKDANGNFLAGNILEHNSKNNLVIAQHRLVVLANVDDLVVVETPDVILIKKK